MRELAGPLLLIVVVVGALLVWARVDRARRQRRWREMAEEVALRRAINESQVSRAKR